jgi:Spy/CpxP family protein refolding chaperone
MQGKFNFKVAALAAVLIGLLAVPALGQTKAEHEAYYKECKAKMIKDLQLAPDKEKAMQAVGEKYAAERQGIITGLRKADADLEAALKAPNPDEAKVKGLVSAVAASQDKLFGSFKNQRDEELALMTPVQQGKYLIAVKQWRHDMMGKQEKKSGEKK